MVRVRVRGEIDVDPADVIDNLDDDELREFGVMRIPESDVGPDEPAAVPLYEVATLGGIDAVVQWARDYLWEHHGRII